MISFIRRIIRAFAARHHKLSCRTALWREGIAELGRRGDGRRESGAFMLGRIVGGRREIVRFVYYDDLDPECLDTGAVVFAGTAYAKLWQMCRESGLSVVADAHTHPYGATQSQVDRENPMIATAGHVAVIVPNYAMGPVEVGRLGMYVYAGDHRWHEVDPEEFFYTGVWA